MAVNYHGISIGTVSGGIVNFGGAVYISPISITKTNTGSGESNTGAEMNGNSEMETENERNTKSSKRC